MLRFIICVISLNLTVLVSAQTDLADIREQEMPEMRVDMNFSRKYKRQLHLMIRTYPMALKAKELIDDYEADLSEIEKKRKQKKYGRKAHKELKEEFSFNIRDLYRSEGDMLMKLIHRETGMTVKGIIERYRGDMSSEFYESVGKIWDHNLEDTFDPKAPDNDDWITELVIQDIISGKIEFDTEMKRMDKSDYKESMKEYRQGMKDSRKKSRLRKRQAKKKED